MDKKTEQNGSFVIKENYCVVTMCERRQLHTTSNHCDQQWIFCAVPVQMERFLGAWAKEISMETIANINKHTCMEPGLTKLGVKAKKLKIVDSPPRNE